MRRTPLPQNAVATVNCRILPRVPSQSVRDTLVEVIGDPTVTVTLGDVSRRDMLRAQSLEVSAGTAGHGTEFPAGPYRVLNSYHCSRLDTNTGGCRPKCSKRCSCASGRCWMRSR